MIDSFPFWFAGYHITSTKSFHRVVFSATVCRFRKTTGVRRFKISVVCYYKLVTTTRHPAASNGTVSACRLVIDPEKDLASWFILRPVKRSLLAVFVSLLDEDTKSAVISCKDFFPQAEY